MTPIDEEQITVLIVDDHPLLREGIAAVLASERGLLLVAQGANGREAIERYRAHRRCDADGSADARDERLGSYHCDSPRVCQYPYSRGNHL
jgi:CheY-like chemotaxis protein